jgi:hypothetical protein
MACVIDAACKAAWRGLAKTPSQRNPYERDCVRAALVLEGKPTGNWPETQEAIAQLRDFLPKGVDTFEWIDAMYTVNEAGRYRLQLEEDLT